MERTVDFLNLEYILTRAYELLVGFHLGGANAWANHTATTLILIGMALCLVLLVLLVYAQIQLLRTEHEGFHGKEAEHHERVEAAHAHPEPPKNDRWERIVQLASSANESERRRAVLEADIMLGDALTAQGYPGTTVGEQLRHANPLQMTTLDLAWKAHKVRNDIAHGGERYELTDREARVSIGYYKRVFDELGAI